MSALKSLIGISNVKAEEAVSGLPFIKFKLASYLITSDAVKVRAITLPYWSDGIKLLESLLILIPLIAKEQLENFDDSFDTLFDKAYDKASATNPIFMAKGLAKKHIESLLVYNDQLERYSPIAAIGAYAFTPEERVVQLKFDNNKEGFTSEVEDWLVLSGYHPYLVNNESLF